MTQAFEYRVEPATRRAGRGRGSAAERFAAAVEDDVNRLAGEGWEPLPVRGGYVDAGRGVGLQDMAVRGRELRASGELGQHVLEGPGVCLHRTANSGRNFEYFSEDPYLSSVMGVEVTQNHGVTAMGKHFALNDQGT